MDLNQTKAELKGKSECEIAAMVWRAESDKAVLIELLKPFSQFSCSPIGECDCHNCKARDFIVQREINLQQETTTGIFADFPSIREEE